MEQAEWEVHGEAPTARGWGRQHVAGMCWPGAHAPEAAMRDSGPGAIRSALTAPLVALREGCEERGVTGVPTTEELRGRSSCPDQ